MQVHVHFGHFDELLEGGREEREDALESYLLLHQHAQHPQGLLVGCSCRLLQRGQQHVDPAAVGQLVPHAVVLILQLLQQVLQEARGPQGLAELAEEEGAGLEELPGNQGRGDQIEYFERVEAVRPHYLVDFAPALRELRLVGAEGESGRQQHHFGVGRTVRPTLASNRHLNILALPKERQSTSDVFGDGTVPSECASHLREDRDGSVQLLQVAVLAFVPPEGEGDCLQGLEVELEVGGLALMLQVGEECRGLFQEVGVEEDIEAGKGDLALEGGRVEVGAPACFQLDECLPREEELCFFVEQVIKTLK